MPELDLTAIRAANVERQRRQDAASYGPWEVDQPPGYSTSVVKRGSWIVARMAHFDPRWHEPDATLMAAARTDDAPAVIEALCVEVEQLWARVTELEGRN